MNIDKNIVVKKLKVILEMLCLLHVAHLQLFTFFDNSQINQWKNLNPNRFFLRENAGKCSMAIFTTILYYSFDLHYLEIIEDII